MRITIVLLLPFALSILTAATMAASLEIDPVQSKIEVTVKATTESFVGQLEKFVARVDWGGPPAPPSQANVSFDFADLKTGNKGRDAAMLKWLEYDANRSASFHLTGWKQDGGTNLALGELTLHGVTQAIQSSLAIKQGGAVWDIIGTAEFDYRDFKLPKIRKALVLSVDPHLKVNFHLVGKFPVAK